MIALILFFASTFMFYEKLQPMEYDPTSQKEPVKQKKRPPQPAPLPPLLLMSRPLPPLPQTVQQKDDNQTIQSFLTAAQTGDFYAMQNFCNDQKQAQLLDVKMINAAFTSAAQGNHACIIELLLDHENTKQHITPESIAATLKIVMKRCSLRIITALVYNPVNLRFFNKDLLIKHLKKAINYGHGLEIVPFVIYSPIGNHLLKTKDIGEIFVHALKKYDDKLTRELLHINKIVKREVLVSEELIVFVFNALLSIFPDEAYIKLLHTLLINSAFKNFVQECPKNSKAISQAIGLNFLRIVRTNNAEETLDLFLNFQLPYTQYVSQEILAQVLKTTPPKKVQKKLKEIHVTSA